MPVIAVIGSQWGDEGKGKIVDLLSLKADVVVRSQGGANAGHTIHRNGKKIILHLIPSGILSLKSRCLIGPGVVLDPEIFSDELESLQALGIDPKDRLTVDYRTHLVFPTHKLIDQSQEAALGKDMIGTTARGIGPAYSDKAARRGIRIAELLDSRRRRKACGDLYTYHAALLKKVYKASVPTEKAFRAQCEAWAELLSPLAGDTVAQLRDAVDRDQTVLLEGAQGSFLDINLGTYPYVTSSHPTVGGAIVGAGLPHNRIDFVLGVIKAYCTRVGQGPFPTEMDEETAEKVRRKGAEFGSTTGRPRRCGWLDLAAAKQAAYWNGIDGWAVTKLDVLDGLEPLKVGIGYQIRGRVITSVPATQQDWDDVEPVYGGLKSWKNCCTERRIEKLPSAAQDYLETIEKFTGVPVRLVSVGADSEATIPVRGDLL